MTPNPSQVRNSEPGYKELEFKPFRKRAKGINYNYGFWTSLLKEIKIKLHGATVAFLLFVIRVLFRAFIAFKRNWRKELFVGTVFLLALLPQPYHVKALTVTPKPLYIKPIPLLSPVQPITTPVPPEAEQVIPPPPPPAPVAPVVGVSGCGDNMYKQFIYQHESGCRTDAINPNGACGLGQAWPCQKMGCSLSDWACQDAFFTNYANATYGGWANAYAFWQSHSWW